MALGWLKNKEDFSVVGEGVRLDLPGARPRPITIPDGHRKGHFWCFGTTRAGKSKLMENLIEQDIRKGRSVVAIDPKVGPEGIELFCKIVQVAFEEGRQDELIFVSPIFPGVSAILDPLSHYYMPEELVGHIVSGVPDSKDKFFANVAYEISLVIVQGLIMLAEWEGRPPAFNLNDVKNLMSRDELGKLMTEIEAIDSDDARQLAQDMKKIVESPQDYYGKISSSLRVALMELTSGNIGKIIGKADENRFINRLERGERVIMVVQLGSMLTRKAAFTVGRVVVSMIQSLAGRIGAAGRRIDPPLALYMDETQNFLYHGIDDLFAKAGGLGVWLHGFCQSVSQLYGALGRDYGNVILDNTNTKVFMRVPDFDTAKYGANFFGKVKTFSPVLSVGAGISMREVEEDMILPEKIKNQQERQFYMDTYSGAYRGGTADVSEQWLDVRFPEPGEP
ncbi:MAG: type IV secretory system conjugative DNA transfer family protein [Candidatus Nitrospinota bacterium M3_3B_026]